MSGKRALEGGIYTRTRNRLKASEYKGKATIHDLPIEVIWRIIDYLDPECFFQLRGLCDSVSKTLVVIFYHEFRTIPGKIESVKKKLLNTLFSGRLCDDSLRLDSTKSLLYLDWLEKELVIFESILRRYDVSAESNIFTGLWSAAKEIKGRIDRLTDRVPLSELLADCRVLNPAATLPLWSRLVESLDEEFDRWSGGWPFETKLLDILCCCPSSNMKLEMRRSPTDRHVVRLAAFFQIHNSCTDRSLPEFRSDSGDLCEKTVLRFLRSVVRTRNSIFVANLYNDLKHLEWRLISSFLKDSDRRNILACLQDKYTHLSSSHYEPLYFYRDKSVDCFIKTTTLDVSNNFVECVFQENKVGVSDVPLIAVAPNLFDAIESSASAVGDHDRLLSEQAGGEDALFKLTVICKRWGENNFIELTRRKAASDDSTVFSLVRTSTPNVVE